jgi:signal transduction histidine kinase
MYRTVGEQCSKRDRSPDGRSTEIRDKVRLDTCSRITRYMNGRICTGKIDPLRGRLSGIATFSRENAVLKKYAAVFPPQIMLPFGIGITAFLIDLQTPDDIADGFFYILAVVSCVWVPYANSAFYTAFGLMLPISLGFVASPLASPPWTGIFNRVLGAIVMWLVAFVVWRNAHLIRDRERALAQLELLHRAAESGANAERIELSRWLHEGLAQQLVAVGWSLDRIASQSVDERKVQSEASELRITINDALRTVHRKAVELRKVESDPDGLPVLVGRHIADFTDRTGLPVDVGDTTGLDRVPVHFRTLCLAFIQEALTNVAKHAGASRIVIEIRGERAAIHIKVTDDGCGIDAGARRNPDSLGLLGLQERLTAIGGALMVSNVTPHGARIEARVPIE